MGRILIRSDCNRYLFFIFFIYNEKNINMLRIGMRIVIIVWGNIFRNFSE